MAYTFLRAQGKPVGRSRVEEDKIDLARETLARAAQASVGVLLPGRSRRGRQARGRARPTRVVSGRRLSRRPAGRRHRSGDREALCRGDRRGADRALERADGHLRDRRLQPRHDGGRRRRSARCRGVTVVGGGDSVAALARAGQDRRRHARLDRRRRVARVPRGTRAARREGAGGLTLMARIPLLAGNWKMHGTRAEATALAGALAKSVGAVAGSRGADRPALHGAGCRARGDRGHAHPARQRRTSTARTEGRLHGRGLGGHARRRRVHARHHRPLGAPAVLSARPTPA